MELVDSHCHLPLIANDAAGIAEVVERARAAGVVHMLCVGVDLETFPGVLAAARAHPNVSASVGVHPNTDEHAREPTVEGLATLADDPAVVAIGETGLDYFRSEGELDWQRARFRTHIRAARETGKPIIVHCREAATDVIDILRDERAADVGGVMHCFVDTWETACAAMELGFYVSLSGIVTFRNAGALRDVAVRVPAERLLIETDSPWLAPVPKRGKQNEPAYVQHTAACVAELRGTTPESLAATTTRNFFELFRGAA